MVLIWHCTVNGFPQLASFHMGTFIFNTSKENHLVTLAAEPGSTYEDVHACKKLLKCLCDFSTLVVPPGWKECCKETQRLWLLFYNKHVFVKKTLEMIQMICTDILLQSFHFGACTGLVLIYKKLPRGTLNFLGSVVVDVTHFAFCMTWQALNHTTQTPNSCCGTRTSYKCRCTAVSAMTLPHTHTGLHINHVALSIMQTFLTNPKLWSDALQGVSLESNVNIMYICQNQTNPPTYLIKLLYFTTTKPQKTNKTSKNKVYVGQ